MRSQDVKIFQNKCKELLQQHQIYIECIGLFDGSKKEICSVS